MDTKLEKIVNKILEIIVPDKIILFGSRARNEFEENSDYDILVVKSGITNKREICKKIYRNMFGTNASVDIILEVPDVLEVYKNSAGHIYKHILNDGKIIYEK